MPIYNYAAGPATLPKEVLKTVQAELLDYHHSGMSILEISHRSALFDDIINQAQSRLLKLMHLGSDFTVLFLQGGGSLQFTMVPLNLAGRYHRVAYANTGHWSERAIEEAKRIPNLQVDQVTDAGPEFATIPPVPSLTEQYDYLHITTNNTIFGTAYHQLPQTDCPLVADASSNFLAEAYPFDQFDLLYAGAQKNLAPAGLTIVVVKKSCLHPSDLPTMLNYEALAKKNSLLNTPPVFQIYVANLVLRWLEQQGGVEAMEELNKKKANLIYDFLDGSKLFHNDVDPAARSLVNIPFKTNSKGLDQEFIQAAADHGLLNLKGHRLVGGMRASLYNAMPYAGAVALRDFMAEFEAAHL
ncbi:MAG: 3-phosphoserine/phosphohydroxythreonine transaminase [Lactobacillus sp.]|nr:3-phosphoserine/phosphohydroxythreonine transaminase [Lactobacillus sp.]